MYDVKVSGGEIVTAEAVFRGDVVIGDGKIALVGDASGVGARRTVDASGMYVLPGLLDCHAHLNDPGFTWREDFPHGSAAAALGGVTTVIDMPLQNEPALTDAAVFAAKEKAISGRAYVDYAFWGGFVGTNIDDLAAMDRAGAVAYKTFVGPVSPDYSSVDYGRIRRALFEIGKFDGLAGFHCEDYSLIKAGEESFEPDAGWRGYFATRPLVAEVIAAQSILELSRETGTRVHICHVSHPDVAELLRRARREGVRATGETCPHYLVFCEDDAIRGGAVFKCAPPLRDASARDGLWEYVADGTLACLCSDHSPCRLDEKDEAAHGVLGAWGGISGIQSVMQVVFDRGVVRRGLSPAILARSSLSVARAFSLDRRKGAIRPGLDADLVILDPNREWEITPDSLAYLNRFSAFVGLKGRGMPVLTMVRGVEVARDGAMVGEMSHGKLIRKLSRKDF